MKAVLALLLASLALSSALTIVEPYYQAYDIYYSSTDCSLASILSIELGDSWNYARTSGGVDINTYCTSGTTCTPWSSGSYETVCVSGEPMNLGIKVITLWSTCDATSVMPFKDDYVASGTWPTTREETDLATFIEGCNDHYSLSGSFQKVVVNTAGVGCSLFTSCVTGNCTTDGVDCYATADWTVATASGCAVDARSSSPYDYIECAVAPYVAPATKADLFSYDPSRIIFTQGNCATGCPSYYLGDGFCDAACQNAACDNDCDSEGNCDCCVPASQSSCCTPSAFGSVNQCCEVDPLDQELVANNTNYIKIFEACLCGGINDHFDLDSEVAVGATGVCDLTNAATLMSDTTTTGENACLFADILSWCYGHAVRDGHYIEDVATNDANSEWYTAVSESLSTEGPGGSDISPLPDCLAMGGMFTTEFTDSTGYPAGSINSMCENIKTLYSCETVCGSASALAVSTLFALVF